MALLSVREWLKEPVAKLQALRLVSVPLVIYGFWQFGDSVVLAVIAALVLLIVDLLLEIRLSLVGDGPERYPDFLATYSALAQAAKRSAKRDGTVRISVLGLGLSSATTTITRLHEHIREVSREAIVEIQVALLDPGWSGAQVAPSATKRGVGERLGQLQALANRDGGRTLLRVCHYRHMPFMRGISVGDSLFLGFCTWTADRLLEGARDPLEHFNRRSPLTRDHRARVLFDSWMQYIAQAEQAHA